MREFVDENQLRFARECRVKIEFAELAAAVFDVRERQHVEAVEQRRGLAAPVRLRNADDDVDAFVLAPPRGLQHRIRLAHAGRRAEENLQLAALAFCLVALQPVEQLIRIGSVHA